MEDEKFEENKYHILKNTSKREKCIETNLRFNVVTRENICCSFRDKIEKTQKMKRIIEKVEINKENIFRYSHSILSFFLGWPPVIHTILLFDFKAYCVDSKVVALESFIKVLLPNFKNISCLCDKPLKDSKDFKKSFLLIWKNFAI